MSFNTVENYNTNKKNLLLRLIVLLLFFTIIAVAIFLYSPYSKITSVNVKNASITDENLILQATGLELGDSFLKVNSKKIKSTLEKLNTIKSAEVIFKFPNDLDINLQEKRIIAYIVKENDLLPLLEDSTVLYNQNNIILNKQRPIITTALKDSDRYKLAVQLTKVPEDVIYSLSEFIIDDKNEIVTIYTIDGNELRMFFDEVYDKLLIYKDIKNTIQIQGQNKGIINMFDAIWFNSYDEAFEIN